MSGYERRHQTRRDKEREYSVDEEQDVPGLSEAVVANMRVGDHVNFGRRLPLAKEYVREPIEWRVLEVAEDTILLLADEVLTVSEYYSGKSWDTWENSVVREVLNNAYYFNYFSPLERRQIADTHLVNDSGRCLFVKNIAGGNDTIDKVFVLSVAEVKKYMRTWNSRRAFPADHFIGVWAGDFDSFIKSVAYWVRNPGVDPWHGKTVTKCGNFNGQEFYVSHLCGVRPALRLKRDPNEWK